MPSSIVLILNSNRIGFPTPMQASYSLFCKYQTKMLEIMFVWHKHTPCEIPWSIKALQFSYSFNKVLFGNNQTTGKDCSLCGILRCFNSHCCRSLTEL